MNTKTMEGLVGARANMDLVNTPMRVFKEARRKGNTAAMERAMGYAAEFSDKAQEYKAEADKGMEEDAREAREKAKLQCEEAVRKRGEEQEKPEDRIDEGKVLLKDGIDSESTGHDEIKADAVREPVTYTKTGETVLAEQEAGISVFV